MAKTLLSGASILYAGDPLRDLALGVFLDRFAEKKPKSRRKSETWHGSLPVPSRKVRFILGQLHIF
jgi:ribosome biogenesis protein MAK21